MYENYRKEEINSHISRIGFRPLDVMVAGATGAGKSSTLNSFFNKTVAKVGEGADPETMELDCYSLTDEMRFWDSPGLGDGFENDKAHSKKIIKLLNKTYDNNTKFFLDMAVVIIDAGTRDIGTVNKLLEEVILTNIETDRVVVALNQADFAMKGRHWDSINNCPDQTLLQFLEEKAYSVQRRINDFTGKNISKPVYYSAKYNYNIDGLYDLIIDNMPDSARKVQ